MKIAIIGFGFMGRTHAINLVQTEGHELCAIVNKTPPEIFLNTSGGNLNTGELDTERLKEIPYFEDTAECLKAIRPDAAIICVPTLFHAETTRLCLEQGCHVLLEKPICLDPEQAEEMIVLAKAKQRTFMVAHCLRFFPEYELLKKTIESQRLGSLKMLKMSRFSGEPSWGSWQEKQIKESSGGALFDLLIHDIDFLNSALGKPEKIWNSPALTEAFRGSYINSTWEYPDSGTLALVEGGNCYPPQRPFEAGYSALFENGTMLYSSVEPGKVKFVTADEVTVEDLSCEKSGYLKELEYFLECAKSGRFPEKCPPEEALAAIQLCHRHLALNQE